jgi:hypothetical protein
MNSSLDFEKLDLTPGTPSMASVFSSSDSNAPTPRSQSPSAQSSHSRKSSFKFGKRRSSSVSSNSAERKQRDDSLSRWLRDGTVIYKSVGLGLMDLVVGMHIVKLAGELGIGTVIEGFGDDA